MFNKRPSLAALVAHAMRCKHASRTPSCVKCIHGLYTVQICAGRSAQFESEHTANLVAAYTWPLIDGSGSSLHIIGLCLGQLSFWAWRCCCHVLPTHVGCNGWTWTGHTSGKSSRVVSSGYPVQFRVFRGFSVSTYNGTEHASPAAVREMLLI